jgi:L-threonylcarbamoyladenylate synthase
MENKRKQLNTKILNWKDKKALISAKKVILDGGLLVYPTDTIYGFGVNAKNREAVDNLNSIKNREGPISVIIESKEKASNWVDLPEHEIKVALQYIKAKTTIIFPVKRNIVDNKILGPHNTLGMRFSNHPFCISLANYCNVPITTTSVNRTGEKPKINVDEILNSFNTGIDLIIEDGALANHASKIYKYDKGDLKSIR